MFRIQPTLIPTSLASRRVVSRQGSSVGSLGAERSVKNLSKLINYQKSWARVIFSVLTRQQRGGTSVLPENLYHDYCVARQSASWLLCCQTICVMTSVLCCQTICVMTVPSVSKYWHDCLTLQSLVLHLNS